jgi:pimeloyl-ACP methyl ester carboxylesterase
VLFDGFEVVDVDTPRGPVHARVGGSGPPLLVLHGYPQTHLMWHPVAPALAERFTVVAADLPGYGDSFLPPVSEDHSAHSKRALAADLVAAMEALGHSTFSVAGHDRGGRVAYRMALDPAHAQAMCEDYRAGASIDRELDDADRGTRTIACPVRALWGAWGALPHLYGDPLELWRPLAPEITGRAVEEASHFLVEDMPDEVVADLAAFFG